MKRSLPPTLLALFFVTGFASLVYEVLWVRMFTLVFGATVFAVSTVLTAFFAGLALGSVIFGRIVDRIGRHLLLYGLVEVAIGAYALILPSLVSGLEPLYPELARDLGDSFPLLSLARFAVCFLLILLPTTLMGATLPILSRHLVESRSGVVKGVGYLYAINTAGACLGCFVTGMFLIESIGVAATHTLAVALNFAVGALALVMHARRTRTAEAATPSRDSYASQRRRPVPRRDKRRRRRRKPERSARDTSGFLPCPPRTVTVVLVAFSVSGAAALGYEVLWTRTLGVALQSTTYSFTLILTTFLCGIGLGSYLFGKLSPRLKSPVLCFAGIEIAIGLCGLAMIHVLRIIPDLASTFGGAAGAEWAGTIGLQMLLCLATMLIPTLLFGCTFPLATRICTSRLDGLGATVGTVNAINSAGAIVGSFVVGFLVIPSIGVKQSLILVATANLVAGLAVAVHTADLGRRPKRVVVLATALVAAVGLTAGQATDLYVGMGTTAEQRRVLYYDDGLVANVRVEQTADNIFLLINDKVQAGRRGARASQGLGHIPMLLHPNPRQVLTIGMGAGMTAGAISRHPIESLTIVDLVDSLADCAAYFAEQNHDVLKHSRVRFVVEDGRNYLLTSEKRYDLIVSDIFFPATAGTGNLYSLEHYRLARARLHEDGAMVQWLPLYQLSEVEFRIIAATFLEAFPHVELWLGDPDLMYPVVGLVGRNRLHRTDIRDLRERMAGDEVAGGLVFGSDPVSLLASFLMGSDGIDGLAAGARINTNDRPWIEFSAPRNDYANRRLGWQTMQRLTALKASAVPLLDLGALAGEERDEVVRRLQATEQARIHYYRGTFALGEGRSEEGYQEYRQARTLAPSDAFVDFHTSESVGRLHASLGNPDRAVTLLESAASIRPDEVEPRLLLASLYARMERWDLAESHLTEVIRLHPEHGPAHSQLGEIYSKQERWSEAASALSRSLEIVPVAEARIRRLRDRAAERAQTDRR